MDLPIITHASNYLIVMKFCGVELNSFYAIYNRTINCLIKSTSSSVLDSIFRMFCRFSLLQIPYAQLKRKQFYRAETHTPAPIGRFSFFFFISFIFQCLYIGVMVPLEMLKLKWSRWADAVCTPSAINAKFYCGINKSHNFNLKCIVRTAHGTLIQNRYETNAFPFNFLPLSLLVTARLYICMWHYGTVSIY